jgi:hypothetical protein
MPAPRGVFALLTSLLAAAATVAATAPGPAAEVSWPASTGLVVAEVVTGGASASDEYVEIENAGSGSTDLGGCELVYVTASGTTTTRKAGFASPAILKPGQHLLVANAAGIYAAIADATYSVGLAADGGSLALRRVGGEVIDAVGWGTAANAYVEGSAAPAPPARSSIERRPGGSSGNNRDTNDNAADWFVQASPVPQPLAPAPQPSDPPATPATNPPTTAPTETGTPIETATATATVTEPSGPTQSAGPTPSTGPTGSTPPADSASPGATPDPSIAATEPAVGPTPSPPAVSPSPTASPTASPTPSPTGPPALETIALARARPVGSRVQVQGVVTIDPGFAGADGLFAIQDSSGGIYVRLAASVKEVALGRTVTVDGTLAAPYGQLEIRSIASLEVAAGYSEPVPVKVAPAEVGEATEGSLVSIAGKVTSVQSDGGRITVTLADDRGSVRLLADPPSGIATSDVVRGSAVVATGVAGQRETATGRLDGYRVWLRSGADIVATGVVKTAAPTSGSGATSSTGASAAPGPQNLAAALKTRGAAVDVVATVTATAGLLDLGDPTIVVDDGTAAAAVILPASAVAPPVGMHVRVTGKVGRWETGPTVLASSVVALGELEPLEPVATTGPLDASLEWRLVRACGRIDGFVRAGARWRIDMTVDGHKVSALGEPAAAIAVDKTSVGRLAVVTGIVRRSTSDSTVFQMLPRTAPDLRLGPAPATSGAGSSAGAGGTGAVEPGAVAGSAGQSVPVASLASYVGRTATVAGLVTATAAGTATVDDGTGAVRLGGRAAADEIAMLEPGDAIEATGLVTRDAAGLLIDTDPASLVSLSLGTAASADGGSSPGATGSGVVARSTARPPVMPVAIRDTSGRSPSPQALVLCGLLVVLCGLAAAIVAVAVRRGRIGPGPAARLGGSRLPRGRDELPPGRPDDAATRPPAGG